MAVGRRASDVGGVGVSAEGGRRERPVLSDESALSARPDRPATTATTTRRPACPCPLPCLRPRRPRRLTSEAALPGGKTGR